MEYSDNLNPIFDAPVEHEMVAKTVDLPNAQSCSRGLDDGYLSPTSGMPARFSNVP
jgi:hypothetical protein